MEHFAQISRRYLSRRQFLGTAAATSLAACTPSGMRSLGGPPKPGFTSLPHSLDAHDAVAPGYKAQPLIRWGDSLDGSAPTNFPLNAYAQLQAFGFNNDFIAYIPLSGSERGLLCVNHEYPQGHLMFPGLTTDRAGKHQTSAEQVASEMAAVGHSVIEIENAEGGWRVVPDSAYRRRIHAGTLIKVSGPAAGHDLLRTSADPSGRMVLGTLGCCSGGKTPWGTVLIGEENVGDYFKPAGGASKNDLEQDDLDETFLSWAKFHRRFDLGKEPNELNRFGWVVEYDPTRPDQPPVKRTALGRFEHEGATPAWSGDGPLVVYSGDDDENQFLYRYVSDDAYRAGGNTDGLLDKGTLYCARFNDDGTGEWLALRHGEGPLVATNGFSDQGAVLVHTRRAAALLGATPMDRPEGIAIAPDGRVYAAMTKNKNKPGANAANPRQRNASGHVIEITPPAGNGGREHWQQTFTWDILLEGGDPAAAGDLQGRYGERNAPSAWLANPDNLAFDARGRLWIATDGLTSFGAADGVFCCSVSGSRRADTALLYRCPRGAELCGPEFTPDGRTLFVAVQHPADEDDSHFSAPSTRWPDFDPDTPPRPAIVAITRNDGGLVGD